MRPILCVVDLTESSVKVLEVAARMAYAHQSRLTILHPYRLLNQPHKGEGAALKAKLEQEAREKFFDLQRKVPLLERVTNDFKSEIGFASSIINSYVSRNKVDIIVIGQRQANEINEINGMALQNLITASKLPFTIIPEDVDAEILLN